MDIAFCYLEQSKDGFSINNLVRDLTANGWNESYLVEELERLGYEQGASIMDEIYRLIEKRCYPVNDEFPRICPESFINGTIPAGISKINYSVNLDHLKSRESYL